jgi:hypothetical protein
MYYFLNAGVPILGVSFYCTVALMAFHRYRRRHVESCEECKRKIEKNLEYWQGHYPWNHLLCDRYDLGAFGVAAFWPIAWFAYKLFEWTRVDPKPSWLQANEMRTRIEELEREAGIR